MSADDFIWRFSPGRTSPELLEEIFVQRESLLRNLIEQVAESATTGSKHHVLLIGPRGFGKTHLITLLNYRLAKNPSLASRIRVAWLQEDETITSFVQMLKRIYEILARQDPDEFPPGWLNELLDESPKRIQRLLQDKLIQAFTEKTLLLCVENLDNLFSGLGADGQHEWRAFLQEHPFTTIMASTQRLFADVKTRDKPFFGFFSPVHLEPLNVNDAVELLRRVARNRSAHDLVTFLDSPEGRSRVRALHHLAGGNHRIYVVLSGFITRESLDDLVGPFQKMADDLTPYYQERLRWLSPQQRQIVEYLCSQDRPCMPKQIARQLLAAENTVSSQLGKLLEIGYILRSQRGRESLYELSETLMRLASEVKEQQRRPLQMLVNFLRVWYRPDELPHEEAIACFDNAIGHDPHDCHYWNAKGSVLTELKRFDEAIACFNKAIEVEPTWARPWFHRPGVYMAMNHWSTALTELRTAMREFVPVPEHDVASMIDLLCHAFLTGNAAAVGEFSRLYTEFGAHSHLGDGLVRSLAKIGIGNATPASLGKWRDFWNEFGAPYPEMQIPLRLFGVGIEYLVTQDRKALLDLVLAERQILEQALEMETPAGD